MRNRSTETDGVDPWLDNVTFAAKAPRLGNQVTTRGKKKYLGGVGTKVTGISRRKFKPNLQRVNVTTPNGNKAIQVCTQCLRSGAVTKVVRAAPFKVPHEAGARRSQRPAKPLADRFACEVRPMAITRQDVEKVALLGRLQLTEAELATMTEQLAQIVGYVDHLAQVNTDGVEPMAHAIEQIERVPRRRRDAEACRATRRWPTPRITIDAAIWCRPCWANSLRRHSVG